VGTTTDPLDHLLRPVVPDHLVEFCERGHDQPLTPEHNVQQSL